MPEDKREFVLDASTIDLPSDRVTVGQIRRRQPYLFTSEGYRQSLLDIDVIAIADVEVALAAKVFAATLKLPDPRPHDDPRDLVDILNTSYREWGLSSGMQQTKQLVREFQEAAVRQAKALRGKSR